MFCPYCDSQYTIDQPCLCQPPVAVLMAKPDNAPGAEQLSDNQAIAWNACRGNRID